MNLLKFTSKTILEIYSPEKDTWSRIEHGNWKSEEELNEHIKKLSTNNIYFKCSKKETNIPEQYKYTMFNFHDRYPSAQKRNAAVKEFYERIGGCPEKVCPLII
jgi:hypothetical protein